MGNASHEKTATKEKTFQRTVAVLLAALLLWQVFDFVYTQQIVRSHHDYERGSIGMDLINPKVLQYELSDIAIDVKGEILEKITEFKKENELLDFGMYVRDLDSGYGFGINENEQFIPASLLKVLSMVTYLKISETDPLVLEKTFVYDGVDLNDLQSIESEDKMKKGESYTVENLIRRAVVFSDNNANALLMQHIEKDAYQKVFAELGIPFSVSSDQKSITPKIYSNLFRILFNATFLNKENSQKALQLLTEARFDAGLQAGINGSVKLANKFGERKIQENGVSVFYLHDCGIVYTKHPYVVCMMTKGFNIEKLESILGSLSEIIYSKMKY